MPSPVNPSQFCDAVPSPNADLCTRLTRFFNIANLLCDFFSYFLDSNGSISDAGAQDIALRLRPPGEIAMSATTSMGSLWLLCDGSQVSRTTYASLFAAIGTRYGSGDGSTTFNLPDCRGRSPIGAGAGTAGGALTDRSINSKYVGEETHTQSISELPAHTHEFATTNGQQVLAKVTSGKVGDINQGGSLDYAFASPPQNTGSGVPFNVIHPCFIIYYFIKI